MSRYSKLVAKIKERFTQQEVEDDPQSLSARAFRRRVLDEAEVIAPLVVTQAGVAGKRLKVASFEDRSGRVLRPLVRFILVFVAPLLAILLIGLVVYNTVTQVQVANPLEQESLVLGNVPVPAGARPVARAKSLAVQRNAELYLSKVLPQYYPEFKGAASYISPKPVQELTQYYKSKLVDPRPPPWQLYGTPGTYGEAYTMLYLRSLNGQNTLEALVLQLETVNKDILQKDPDYYDRKAQPGESVIVVSKVWLGLR